MTIGLLQKFRGKSSYEDGCTINRRIENDFDVLNDCIHGAIVNSNNCNSVNRLATVGYVRLGTKVIMDKQKETIELQQTVKATELGRRVSNAR
jgi:hypothetical protein